MSEWMNEWMNESHKNANCKERLEEQVAVYFFFPHPAFSWCAACRCGGSCQEGCADPCDWLRDEWGLEGRYWWTRASRGQLLISWHFTWEICSCWEFISLYHAPSFCWGANGRPSIKQWLQTVLTRAGLSSLYPALDLPPVKWFSERPQSGNFPGSISINLWFFRIL